MLTRGPAPGRGSPVVSHSATMTAEEDAMQILSNVFRFMSDYHYYRRVGHFPRAAWILAGKTLPMK